MKILVIHGPNLNLLGTREPDVYGSITMQEINEALEQKAALQNIELEAYQSNAEHDIVTKLQQSMGNIDYIIINPGALTHTSIAIRDTLLGIDVPFYEVHISNIFAREEFRHKSYFSDVALGVICGLGTQGYELALSHIINTYGDKK
ncbi:MAG: type II 3-dehydroquinate dehydratase [SAR86 cluster bacterium]|jgi:3-dehydroquinate dehydratase-2|nr:type II 3-dehydroquinate dehydratase [Gammaproteobacteria bacterium]MDB4043784.1 type II 3-dehydroquinate dehydratase [Gammaproteobacteria bacterium]MDG0966661.1 type II 3-dehydroquinate dehydratase [SAR86 cluster bacterium]MDG2347480.1 type II 3-dehydroquinate dehydratase [SAR86 cluster bacterium]|tara:strand:+ start:1411 stop:1851 length:441 start_codon:yes stop_codon:yes gene_type:complete